MNKFVRVIKSKKEVILFCFVLFLPITVWQWKLILNFVLFWIAIAVKSLRDFIINFDHFLFMKNRNNCLNKFTLPEITLNC